MNFQIPSVGHSESVKSLRATDTGGFVLSYTLSFMNLQALVGEG